MVPTIFNWDAEEVLPSVPGHVLQSAISLSTEEVCEDLLSLHHHHAVVVHSPDQLCTMCSLLFSRTSTGSSTLGNNIPGQGSALHLVPLLLPTPPRFYDLVGRVVREIMQPSQSFQRYLQTKWGQLLSCRHLVGLQVVNGPLVVT